MSTKRRSRRRLRWEAAEKNGRGRMSYEMEAYLAGDDIAFDDARLLRNLMAELWFAKVVEQTRFSEIEQCRVDRLWTQIENWLLNQKSLRFRGCAVACRVLKRYEILMKGREYQVNPGRAFGEAIAPGPNSAVKNIPRDAEVNR